MDTQNIMLRLYPNLAKNISTLQQRQNTFMSSIYKSSQNIDVKTPQNLDTYKPDINLDQIKDTSPIDQSPKELNEVVPKEVNELKDEIKQIKEQLKPKVRKQIIPKNWTMTDDEKKERLLKRLTHKKVKDVDKYIEQVTETLEESGNDEKQLIKKAKEIRKGLRLINDSMIILRNEKKDSIDRTEPIVSEKDE